MDLLDRVLPPARDLLARTDATLAGAGAPPDHEIWPLLRRVGALPSDALEFVAGLSPDPLADVAVELRARSDGYAGNRTTLESAVAGTRWEGAAGSAFAAHWGVLAGHLGDAESADEASMAGRLIALLGYLDEVGEWIIGTRARLAGTLAGVLGSAEAVAVRSASGAVPPHPGTAAAAGGVAGLAAAPAVAAAAIGARVLGAVDAAVTAGHQIAGRWQPRLGELPFVAPEAASTAGGRTRVDL